MLDDNRREGLVAGWIRAQGWAWRKLSSTWFGRVRGSPSCIVNRKSFNEERV
jgi:hypothetical protein